MTWLSWHNDYTPRREFLHTNSKNGFPLFLAGITKESPEFPVSSARLAWERIRRGLRGPAPFIVDSAAHPPPSTHKWKQFFVRGEWSRFTADGLPTKDHGTVTTAPGSAAPSFTQYDLTPGFTQPLMQTLSIHVPQWEGSLPYFWMQPPIRWLNYLRLLTLH